MRKRRIRICIILWVASVFWISVCFYLSWQTGEETVGLSRYIAGILGKWIASLGLEVEREVLHLLVRKLAHIGIFLVVGALVYGSLCYSLLERSYARMISFFGASLLCSICAVVAETVKLQIPGRHLQWDETFLNVVGVICGVSFMWLILWLCSRRRRETIHDT